MIVWVHGGPTDQWRVEHRPRVEFWLDRGWSVLAPNHRGSTGYGRAFTQALSGRWGELDAADVAAGADAAVARGWADPERIVGMGASAGGFTVLRVMATRPGLFAAGVDLYGVVHPGAVTAGRFDAHYGPGLSGPRAADRALLPRADAITDPLLVLHGADDPLIPVADSEALVDRLLKAGRTVEFHVYEGEGHGWSRPETTIDELTRTEEFLASHVPQAS
jgi:dipeptidyl aminopeptidase/acylaminoacyl peptidase